MTVLVVGSAGFIGRNLLKSLEQRGIAARGASSADGTGIDARTGLLPEDFKIPQGTRVVVYLSQSPWYNRVPEMADHVINVNVLSAVRLAELSRRAGVQRFIYTSTGSVYAPAFSPHAETASLRRDNWYSLSKVQGEEALSLFRNDMEMMVTRPFGVYGPGQSGRLVPNMARSVANGKPVEIQRNPLEPRDVDGLRISLCYIDDAVDIYRSLIMEAGPPRLNLAGERAASIREIATTLGRLLNREVSFDMSERQRDCDLIADTTLLGTLFHPRFTSLEDGLKEYVASLRADVRAD